MLRIHRRLGVLCSPEQVITPWRLAILFLAIPLVRRILSFLFYITELYESMDISDLNEIPLVFTTLRVSVDTR